ncbi:MAG: hypothetical protein KHY81_10035, partial [Lachnospiraceae bacterium]|nr:hypothetical protein [Lachnospiraceae bacterium]
RAGTARINACGDSRLRGLRSRKPIGFRQWVVHTQLYDMFLAELAVNNKLYMEIMIRNLWKRMDENYFYYFNKKKKTGIQELNYNGKKILEVVV